MTDNTQDIVERLRRMSPTIDMLECEDVLSAADLLEKQAAEIERLRDASAMAYGLLWHMYIDRRDPNLRLASEARTQVSSALSMDVKGRGIADSRVRMKSMRVSPPLEDGIDPDILRENRDEIARLWNRRSKDAI